MQSTVNPRGINRRTLSATIVLACLLAGCKARNEESYQDGEGFRFTAPPGWVERARGEAVPVGAGHRQQNLPLPPLTVAGNQRERILVRYDLTSTGHHAWLRVTVADLPAATPLKAYLSTRLPGPGWKRESEEENLEVSGLPAARMDFVGRWQDHDYLCETVAVRKGEKVYLFSASFPASNSMAREQVRQAVAGAAWR
jgi:hypothetical protein